MNKQKAFSTLALCALLFAGCSSAQKTTEQTGANGSADTAQTETTNDNSSSTTADYTTDNAADSSLSALDQKAAILQTALEDNGFTIYDLDVEYDSISFKARSSIGTAEVDIESHYSGNEAVFSYQDELTVDIDEDYFATETYSTPTSDGTLTEVTILNNSFNDIYDIECVDESSALTYSLDDIMPDDLDSIKSALSSVGFSF